MMPIRTDLTSQVAANELQLAEREAPANADVDFESTLRSAIERVNTSQLDALGRAEALAAGASDDIHGTMIAAKEAEIGVRLINSIRGKLLDAFHEIWRTGV